MTLPMLSIVRCRGNNQSLPLPDHDACVVRLLTWNLEHLGRRRPARTVKALKTIARAIEAMAPDCVVLQEVQDSTAFDIICSTLGETWYQPAAGRNQHIRLLCNSRYTDCLSLDYCEAREPYPGHPACIPFRAVLKLRNCQAVFQLLGVHLNAKDESVRLAETAWILNCVAASEPHENQIIAGDFNALPEDGVHAAMTHWSSIPKNGKSGTAFPHPGHAEGVEVDYVYTSDFLKRGHAFVLRSDFFDVTVSEFLSVYSDHFPLIADLPLALSCQTQ